MNNLRIQLSTLSPWIYFWFLFISLLWCLSFIWMWQYSMSCTLFLIPFLWLIHWWNKNRMHCSLEHILKPFLHGYVNMTCLAILCQLVGIVVISIFFAVLNITKGIPGFLFYLMVCIVYYVTVEELLKLFFSLKSRDSLDDPVNSITKVHTISSTATALGYSMCTGTIWTFFMSMALAKDDAKDNEEYNLFGWLFLVTLIIAVIGMPMHLITGYITGCKITRKDMEWAEAHRNPSDNVVERVDARGRNRQPFRKYISAVYTNILWRSCYLFFLVLGFLVIQFSVIGVMISLFSMIVDYVMLICHAKKIESQLPFDYLQRAGQLSMFGYNMLADEPNEDDERVSFSAAEDAEHGAGLDLNDNQVVITAANMNRFSVKMDDKMEVGRYGKEADIVVAVDSDSEDEEEEEVERSSPGGGPRLEVPEAVLDESNSNSDEDVR